MERFFYCSLFRWLGKGVGKTGVKPFSQKHSRDASVFVFYLLVLVFEKTNRYEKNHLFFVFGVHLMWTLYICWALSPFKLFVYRKRDFLWTKGMVHGTSC